MRISCSIVSFRHDPGQIERVLSCAAASACPLELYLVDNSPDNRLEPVARRFGATYIHLPHNPGFGAANNRAIQDALDKGADYHLVLNPDIQFGPEVIPALLAFMERQPGVGLVMPDVRYPDGRRQHLCKLLPRPFDLLMRRLLPRVYLRGGWLARYELHGSGYASVMDVPSLSGCFMLLRAATLRQAGGFDERFFMYLEDVDLSRRIGRLARTCFFPDVSIVHDYDKGSYKSLKLFYYHVCSAMRYFNKWGWFVDRERDAINQGVTDRIQGSGRQG